MLIEDLDLGETNCLLSFGPHDATHLSDMIACSASSVSCDREMIDERGERVDFWDLIFGGEVVAGSKEFKRSQKKLTEHLEERSFARPLF